MALTIGSDAPDFTATTTQGEISFHDWLGESWGVIFSHPRDFTPICTTELGHVAKIEPEFTKRGVKVIGISTDPVDNHEKWADDIETVSGTRPSYPIIGDTDHSIANAYGMLELIDGDPTLRTPAENAALRNVFVIGPDKKIKLILIYPMSVGRNFDEILRAIDALQLTVAESVSTPANWNPGDDVVIAGTVSDDAKEKYPEGWETPVPYIRLVGDPSVKQPA